MSTEFDISKEETSALDRAVSALQQTRDAESLDLGNLCEKYRDLRPTIVIIVKLVRKFPGIGPKVATVIEFLMGIADVACPA
jgi:hypothetical protein